MGIKVKIRLNEEMLGLIPSNPEVYAEFIASRAPSDDLAEEEC